MDAEFRRQAIEAARATLIAGGEALMAFRRGDDSYEAEAGAYLLADLVRALTGRGEP